MGEREMWWFDHIAEPVSGAETGGGGVLVGVHPASTCAGQPCAIHDPSDHPLRNAPLNWRGDRRILERVCEHGVGHDDPDDLAFRRSIGAEASGTHGCCGCCQAMTEEVH